jgi:hypothetical protein
MKSPHLNLGSYRKITGSDGGPQLRLPAAHLVTHGVVVGMTGSGKTGLVTVLAEEALRAGIPTIMIDIKGDLPNLLLTFPDFDQGRWEPWLSRADAPLSSSALEQEMDRRRTALGAAGIGETELQQFCERSHVRLITPGSSVGEPLHVLSSLERRSSRWDTDPESARDGLSAAISLVLRLLGRDCDPARSKEHVLLSVLAERRLRAGGNADIPSLMEDLSSPPIDIIGALPINEFLKRKERQALAAALNSLLASPTFTSWREGVSLDIGEWVAPKDGRTPGVDEVYGFLPPHPANPPTKRPIVALMKQARAFGVGVVVATQNPMDLDYRALSNAGLWCIGRLQTDADRNRVVDGLSSSNGAGGDLKELHQTISRLAPRWFVVRNAHVPDAGNVLLNPRHTMSVLRGPLTRAELKCALDGRRETFDCREVSKESHVDAVGRHAVT